MVPPGEVFGFIPTWVAVFVFAGVCFGFTGFVLYTRVFRLILLGKRENRFDQPLRRMANALLVVLGQRKVLQRVSLTDKAGIGHVLIFWGFLSFVSSYILFIFLDSIDRDISRTIFTDDGVKVFVFILDSIGLAILSALLWGLARRWLVRPHRLSFDLTRSFDAVVIVGAIASLMVFTFLVEGFHNALVNQGAIAADAHAASPVGTVLGKLFDGAGFDTLNTLHGAFWWGHLAIILGFGMYIPFSKHMHMVGAPINAFLHDLNARGTLHPIPDIETAESYGANRVRDFTWKELLDGYACAVCGRCTDACPASQTGKVLSPMHIVENIKDHLLEVGPGIIKGGGNGDAAGLPVIGNAVSEEAIWDCVTCGACEQECPVAVEHIDSIVDMRRHLVLEQSKMPETAQNALRSMETRGHPWAGTKFTRTDWAKGLDVKLISENSHPDYLLWVGCTPALEERSQGIVRALVKVLNAAGVNFAILGDEETCNGDPARRMGNEYLFQLMAQQNIETFKKYDITRILTACPHCFNTFKNEYPQFGGRCEVVHHNQLIAD
ncbi:MAG: (Fe-S)-binding protein, partial [Dehalococcoidia bacterium]